MTGLVISIHDLKQSNQIGSSVLIAGVQNGQASTRRMIWRSATGNAHMRGKTTNPAASDDEGTKNHQETTNQTHSHFRAKFRTPSFPTGDGPRGIEDIA